LGAFAAYLAASRPLEEVLLVEREGGEREETRKKDGRTDGRTDRQTEGGRGGEGG